MKPKVIHSYWTRPLETERYNADRMAQMRGNAWLYSLSLAYLLREGFEVELHTDSLGERILGYLPYSKIHTTLDAIPDWVHPRFWAAGKIWALDAVGIGSVHVDGDAFIKNRKLIDVDENTDLIVSHLEEHNPKWLWGTEINRNAECFTDFCEQMGLEKGSPYMYNNGIVGFFNQELLNDYTELYRHFARLASEKYQAELTSKKWGTPDLFAEQMQLYRLCHLRDAKVQFVLNDTERHVDGFQHLVTASKFEDKWVHKVKETLRVFFPEIYKTTNRIWRNI